MHKNCAKDVSSKLAASALISLAFTVIDLSGYKAQLGGKMDYVDESVPFFWKTFCENWRIDNLLVQQYATVMTCLFLDMSLQLCEIQLQQADEMQGASSKLAIRIFYGLVPCILGALSAMVIFFLCPHLSNKSRLWKLLIWKLKRSKDLHQAGNYWSTSGR